jgi:hypothetical protein
MPSCARSQTPKAPPEFRSALIGIDRRRGRSPSFMCRYSDSRGATSARCWACCRTGGRRLRTASGAFRLAGSVGISRRGGPRVRPAFAPPFSTRSACRYRHATINLPCWTSVDALRRYAPTRILVEKNLCASDSYRGTRVTLYGEEGMVPRGGIFSPHRIATPLYDVLRNRRIIKDLRFAPTRIAYHRIPPNSLPLAYPMLTRITSRSAIGAFGTKGERGCRSSGRDRRDVESGRTDPSDRPKRPSVAKINGLLSDGRMLSRPTCRPTPRRPISASERPREPCRPRAPAHRFVRRPRSCLGCTRRRTRARS